MRFEELALIGVGAAIVYFVMRGKFAAAIPVTRTAVSSAVNHACVPPAAQRPAPVPAARPVASPIPAFNSSAALAKSTPALCQYNRLNSVNAGTVLQSVATANPVSFLIRNLTECFAAVNRLYGAALQQGVAAGKISPNFPTPASAAANLRTLSHATYGVRRAALCG